MIPLFDMMRWELARLLGPTRFQRLYFAALDERGAAHMMSVFYEVLNEHRGWA